MGTQSEQPCYGVSVSDPIHPHLPLSQSSAPAQPPFPFPVQHKRVAFPAWGDAQHRGFVQNSTEVPDWVRTAACLCNVLGQSPAVKGGTV